MALTCYFRSLVVKSRNEQPPPRAQTTNSSPCLCLPGSHCDSISPSAQNTQALSRLSWGLALWLKAKPARSPAHGDALLGAPLADALVAEPVDCAVFPFRECVGQREGVGVAGRGVERQHFPAGAAVHLDFDHVQKLPVLAE